MAVEIPADLLAGWLCDRVGRKITLAAAFGAAGALCLSCAVLPASLTAGAAMLGKFAISAAFAIVFVYTAELFPTPLRNVGMGVSSSAARIGGMAAPSVILLADLLGARAPNVVFGSAGAVACCGVLLLPETKGRPMPETVADCDDARGRSSRRRNSMSTRKLRVAPLSESDGDAPVDEGAPVVWSPASESFGTTQLQLSN